MGVFADDSCHYICGLGSHYEGPLTARVFRYVLQKYIKASPSFIYLSADQHNFLSRANNHRDPNDSFRQTKEILRLYDVPTKTTRQTEVMVLYRTDTNEAIWVTSFQGQFMKNLTVSYPCPTTGAFKAVPILLTTTDQHHVWFGNGPNGRITYSSTGTTGIAHAALLPSCEHLGEVELLEQTFRTTSPLVLLPDSVSTIFPTKEETATLLTTRQLSKVLPLIQNAVNEGNTRTCRLSETLLGGTLLSSTAFFLEERGWFVEKVDTDAGTDHVLVFK